jgi:chitinase
MGDAIDNAKIGYLFIQFYNNDYCSAYQLVKPDGGKGDGSNFDEWEIEVSCHTCAGAKLLVGLPASKLASTGSEDGTKYFLGPSELATLVDGFEGHGGLAWVMLWD